MVETATELLLAVLLLLTIVWCTLVHQRLRRLRADKGEMESFIGALTVVTERAEAAISGLKAVGETTHEQLLRQEEAARKRAEELARAMDAAQRMLRRLESGYQQAMRQSAETASRPATTRDRPAFRHADLVDDGERPQARGEGRPVGQPAEARPRISDELLRVLQGLR